MALGGNIGKAVLDLPAFAAERHYVIEYSSFPDRPDAGPRYRHFDSAQRAARPSRPPRYAGELCRDQGAHILTADRRPERRGRHRQRDDAAARGALVICAACRAFSTAEAVEDGVYVRDGLLFEANGGLVEAPISLRGVPSHCAAPTTGKTQRRPVRRRARSAFRARRSSRACAASPVLRTGWRRSGGSAMSPSSTTARRPMPMLPRARCPVSIPSTGSLAGSEGGRPCRAGRVLSAGRQGVSDRRGFTGLYPPTRRPLAYEHCGTLEKAVAAASRDALRSSARAPVVLLSPACASYDQYPNFTVRGETFRKLVAAHEGVSMREAIAA